MTKCRILLGDKENVLDVVLLDIKNLEYHLLEQEVAAASRNFRENRLQFSKSEEEREREKKIQLSELS